MKTKKIRNLKRLSANPQAVLTTVLLALLLVFGFAFSDTQINTKENLHGSNNAQAPKTTDLLFSNNSAFTFPEWNTGLHNWYQNPLENTPAISLENAIKNTSQPTEDPLSKLKPEDEIIELRDATTKHYKNPDGSITAVLSAGPVHYEDNGEWKDVDLDVEENNTGIHPEYAYSSIKNNTHRFYSKYSGDQGLLIDIKGDLFKDWINPEMRWLDANGKNLEKTTANKVQATPHTNNIIYPEVFKNTDVSFKQGSSLARRMDVILKDKSAIANMPEKAEKLAYCEQVIIPEDWTYKTINDPETPGKIREIEFSNGQNKPTVRFFAPEIFEQKNPDNFIFGSYTIKDNKYSLEICKNTPAEWLTDNSRKFPVIVDPTITSQTDNYTGTVGSGGEKWYDDADIGCWDDCTPTRRAWARFNASGIMDGSTFTGATLYTYLRRIPTVANMSYYAYVADSDPLSSTGTTIYGDTSNYSGGSDTVYTSDGYGHALVQTFSSTGYGYLTNRLSNNWFSFVLASFTTSDYFRIYRWDNSSYYPRLLVYYNPPSRTLTASYYYVAPNLNVTLNTTGDSGGLSSCYAYWDTDTTYGSGTSLGNLYTDCDGTVTTPINQSNDTIYYFCTRPLDSYNQYGYHCDSVRYDRYAPSLPIISCGSFTHNVWGNYSSPTCTWTCPDCGPSTTYPRYCTDSSTCSPDIYDSDRSVATSFPEGINYFRVQNEDIAGTSSTQNFIVKRDQTNPTASTNIANTYYGPNTYDTTTTITGTASDAHSGVNLVRVYIERSSDNYYWDGSSFGLEFWPNGVTGTTSWYYSGLPANQLSNGLTYTVSSQAVDNVSLTSSYSNDTFIWDSVNPTNSFSLPDTYYGPTTWNDSSTISGSSYDSLSGVEEVNIVISYVSGSTYYWNGSNWTTSWQTVEPTSFTPGTGTRPWSYTINDSNFTNGRTYTVQVYSYDNAENLSSTASDTFTYDNATPTQPTMNAEPTYSPGSTNFVSTSGSTDSGVGGVQYEFCRNTTDTTTDCTSSGWTSNTNYTFSSLSDGEIYYYFVRAKDSLDNTTDWSQSTSSTQDNSSPNVGTTTIYSGSSYDNIWFNGTISLRASISDSGSDIEAGTCEVSINSSGWTGTGVSQDSNYCYYDSYSPGADFTIQFRVRDNAGNWGGNLLKNYYYDESAPTSTVDIANNYYGTDFNHTDTINGTATDADSGISGVEVRIQESVSNNYWTGSGWSASETWLPVTTGTTTWKYTIDDTNFTSGRNYTVSARATNNVDITESTSQDDFDYDTDGPTGGSVSNTNGYETDTTITVSVNRGTDSGSGMSSTNSDYLLEYQSATLSAGSCGSYGSWTDAGVTETATATSYNFSSSNGNCYKFRYTVADTLGNQTTYTGTDVTKVSTGTPTASCSINEGTNPQYQYQTGTTIYYNSGFTGGFDVNVTAGDTTAGIEKVNFPTLATGFSPSSTDDTSSPYSQTYSWTTSATTSPDAKDATVYSNSGLTNTCGFTVTRDVTAPTGTITYSTQYITSTATDPSMTIGSVTESGSGEDTSTRTLQRATATLSGDTCGTYGSFATTTQGGTYPNITDTGTITDATCYKYRWQTTDNVGNTGTFTTSDEYKVDTTAPSTSVSGITESSGDIYYESGTKTVFYKTPSSSQNFTVNVSASDPQSGINYVIFPGISSTITPQMGNEDPESPYSNQYTVTTSANSSYADNTVTGYNNADLTNTDDFDVTVDNDDPTGASVSCPSAYDTDGNFNVTGSSGSDSGSGVNTSAVYFQRRSGNLSADSCGSYGDYSSLGSANDTNLGQTGLANGCYEYRYLTIDLVGNSTLSSTCVVKVDTSIPTVSIDSITESSNYIYDSGSTLYYTNVPATPGSFTVNVSASDADSGISSVDGSTEFNDTPSDNSTPYTLDYSIEQSSTCTSPITVTATANSGSTNNTTRTCTLDTTAPTGGSASNTNGYKTDTTIAVSVDPGTDSSSGMSTTDGHYLLEYQSATLSGGSCGSYSGWSDAGVTENDTATNYNFSSSNGNCYQFRYSSRDNVYNQATFTGTDTTKVDSAVPSIDSITSVAGDTSSPYYDETDDSSTEILFSSSDPESGVSACKWDTSDVAYASMSNSCASTSSCTSNLSGESSKTVYIRCIDAAGNAMSRSEQVDYTVDSSAPTIDNITSVAGDTTSPYVDGTDDSSTEILFVSSDDGVGVSACKWDTSDVTYASMSNSCASTSSCTSNLSGEGSKTVYIRCTDSLGNDMSSSQQVDYTLQTIWPGGVYSDISVWLKADAGVTNTGDGTDATAWTDQTPNAFVFDHNTTPDIGGTYPAWNNNLINGNPALSFDGSTDRLGRSGFSTWPANDHFIAIVYKRDTLNGDEWMWTYGTSSDDDESYMKIDSSNYFTTQFAGNYLSSPSLSEDIDNGTAKLLTMYRSSGNIYQMLDGKEIATEANGGGGNQGGCFVFAEEPDGLCTGFSTSQHFEGDIAEFIIYDNTVPESDQQKINTYMALKYGISLDQSNVSSENEKGDYLDSSGNVIWDAHDDNNQNSYRYFIAGIGQDDTSDLDQTSSKNNSEKAIVQVSEATSQDDMDFFIWGHNDGDRLWTSTGAPTGYKLLDRQWYGFETNDIGGVDIEFDTKNPKVLIPALISGSDYYFIYDKDADGSLSDECLSTESCDTPGGVFAMADDGSSGDDTSGDDKWTAQLSDLPQGDVSGTRFTLGTPTGTENYPLGNLSDDLLMWLRADSSSVSQTGNDTSATGWTDLGPYAFYLDRTEAGFGGSDPVWYSNRINGQPAVNFSASDDHLGIKDFYDMPDGDLWITTVYLNEDANDEWIWSYGNSNTSLTLYPDGSYRGELADNTLYTDIVGSDDENPHIITMRRSGSTHSQVFDGKEIASESNSGSIYDGACFILGELLYGGDCNIYGSGYDFEGDLGEFIMYDTYPSPTDQQRLHSYLALKYAVPLNQDTNLDYLDSSGNTIWSSDDTHEYDVVGIGQDDDAGWSRTSTKYTDDQNILKVSKEDGTGTMDDSEFLIWGHDNGDRLWTSTDAPSNYQILDRQWQAQETGNLGEIDVEFDMRDPQWMVPALLTDSSFYLVYDSDDDGSLADETPIAMNDSGTSGDDTSGDDKWSYRFDFPTASVQPGVLFTIATKDSAQTYPVGLGTDLKLWLRADSSSVSQTGNDTSATGWTDLGPYAFYLDRTEAGFGGSDPVWYSSRINGQPAVSFAGSDDHLGIKDFYDMPDGDLWITTVYLNEDAGNEWIWSYGDENTFLNLESDGSYEARLANNSLYTGIVGSDDENPHIITMRRSGSTHSQVFDGKEIASESNSGGIYDGACFILGELLDYGDCNIRGSSLDFEGDFGEFIMYDRYPTDTQQMKLHSYLALKFGITLSDDTDGDSITREAIGSFQEGDYVASDGSTLMFDISANGTYVNDVAGIGQDDDSDLSQTSASSANSDSLLEVSSASDLDNLEFMTWANDDGSLSTASTEIPGSGMPTNADARLTREWLFQNDDGNGVGTVTVEFDLNNQSGLRSTLAGDYALLIDADGDFSSGVTIHTTGAALNDNKISFTGATISDGDYVTLAGPAAIGPAGVISNLQLWFKADAGVSNTGSGTNATAWKDQGVGGITLDHNTSPSIDGTYPTYYSSRINNSPALYFEGDLDSNNVGDVLGVDSLTYTPTNNLYLAIVYSGFDGNVGGENIYSYASTSDSNDILITPRTDGTIDAFISGTTVSSSDVGSADTEPHIMATRRDGSSVNIFLDGGSAGSGTQGDTLGTNGCLVLGADQDSVCGGFQAEQYFRGDVAEVVLYDDNLTDTDIQKIDSYLALKYGITLDQSGATTNDGTGNYLDSNGSVIWDAHDGTLQETHRYDIAGIGQDDGGKLNQTQSRSENDDSLLTVSSPTDLGDGEFMVWGNDDGEGFSTEIPGSGIPSNADVRLNREWKIQHTGSVGTVTVAYDLSNTDSLKNSGVAGDYALLIDADGDFSSGATIHTTGASFNGDVISFTGATIADGSYISLAGPEPPRPGGLASNLELWFKADAGVTNSGNGTDVTAWKDRGDYGVTLDHNTSPAIGGTYPTYYNSLFNGNPGLTFDDTSDRLGTDSMTHIPTGDLFVTAVYSRSDTAYKETIFGYGAGNEILLEVDDAGEMVSVVSGTFGYSSSVGSDDGIPHIMSGLRSSSDIYGEFNGEKTNISASDGTALPTGECLVLAEDPDSNCGGFDTSQAFKGDLAELIFYSSYPTLAERQKIYSYLALKYGITLSDDTDGDSTTREAIGSHQEGDYVASDGTTYMVDISSFGSYVNDIAGIGQDDDSGLNQTSSSSVNSDSILTISSPSDLENLEFLAWGNDNGSLATASTEIPSSGLPANAEVRLTREWYTRQNGEGNSNGVGTVNVSFDLNNQKILDKFADASDFALLIDHDDSNFSNVDSIHTTGASINNGVISFTGVNLKNILLDADPYPAYITLAGPQLPSPGGVTGGLNLWLKADAGVTGNDSQEVEAWTDNSVNEITLDHNTSPAIGGTYPTYYNSLFNYNPALDFGPTDRLGVSSLNVYPQDELFIASVYSRDDLTSGAEAIYGYGGDNENMIYMRYNGTISSFISSSQTSSNVDWDDGIPHISVVRRDQNDSHTQLFDGAQVMSATNGTTIPTGQCLVLGEEQDSNCGSFDTNQEWEGNLAEFIAYAPASGTYLSATEQQKILTYLALKYGITLDQSDVSSENEKGDYLDSSGNVIWDAHDGASQNPYRYDIAGIGQDDLSELDQTQSKSVNPDAILRVADAGANQTDGDFLVWGNNNGVATWTTTGAPTNYNILSRQWGAQETVDVGTVDFEFDVEDSDFDVPALASGTAYYFIYDKDGDGSLSDECPSDASCDTPGGMFTMNDDGTDGDDTSSDNKWTAQLDLTMGDPANIIFSIATKVTTVDTVVITGENETDDLALTYNITPSSAKAVVDWQADSDSITVLNMPFEANGGSESTTATDYSTYENNGTVSGATWGSTSGVDSHGAYDFDGSSDYIKITDDDSLDSFSELTIEAWVYKTGFTGYEEPIFSKTQSGGYKLGVTDHYGNNDGKLRFEIHNGSYQDLYSTDVIPTNQWVHVVGTWASGDYMRVYVDGSLDNTSASTFSGTTTNNTADAFIGAESDGSSPQSGHRFDGLIDEVRIYKRQLTADQITDLYNLGTPVYENIDHGITNAGETWQACVTPNASLDGTEVCSNSTTIKPTVDTNTLPAAHEMQSLVADYSTTPSDAKAIFNWKKNQSSYAVANLPFEANGGNESTSTTDYSDSGNNGTVSGATWGATSGIDGGAYTFSNYTDYISLGDSFLDGLTEATFSTWVYHNTTSDDDDIILVGDHNSASPFVFWRDESSTDSYAFLINDGVDYSGVHYSNTVPSQGSWTHLALTFVGGDEVRLYINGTEDGNSPFSMTSIDNIESSTDSIYIGNNFDGIIDELTIFDSALTPQQISTIYNSGTPDYNRIAYQETTTGDDWQACITPNTGGLDGDELCSTDRTITAAPAIDTISFTGNTPDDDLILSYTTDPVSLNGIVDWRIDESSMTILNMPFEANDNKENTEVKDYSSYGNDGTVSDATWSSTGGVDGNGAYSFDGSSDYISLPTTGGVAGQDQVSIEAWINVDTIPADNTAIYTENTTSSSYWRFSLNFRTSDNNIYLSGRDDDGDSFTEWVSGTPDAGWNHVVGVYDAVNNVVKLYINGSLADTATPTLNGFDSGTAAARTIGAGLDSSMQYFFDGLIDEVRLYDRALTTDQITNLYNSGTPDYGTIDYLETDYGEGWKACVTPNDGIADGVQSCTAEKDFLAEVDTVTLASANATEDLSLSYNLTPASSRAIIDWRKDQSSIAALNMPFEANGGSESTTTKDYSDSDNDGTVSGATWSSDSGVDGNGAYSFDGSNNYITASDSANLDITGALSISVWANINALTSQQTLVSKYDANGSQRAYTLEIGDQTWCASNEIAFTISETGSSFNGGVLCSTASLTTGWHHIVATFVPSNSMKIYLDGSDVTDAFGYGSQPDSIYSNSKDLSIGASYDNSATPNIRFFDGVIDEVLIYDHDLTSDQITKLYNSGTPDYDSIAAEETLSGEDWQACVTPNYILDGTEICSNEITLTPGVTDANISVSGGTGTDGTYIVGDTVTVTWDNSSSGDNNPDITGATADLSGWGGSATATMTDTTACSGTSGDDIYEACYTLVSGNIDNTNVNANVTATNMAGSTTGSDTTNATVDNEPPTVTASAITVTGASGTGGAFITGDTATGRWDDSATGDNNSDTISSVSFNLSNWISTADSISGTENLDIWTTAEQSPLDSQSTTNNNVIVTATDNAGNTTTTEGTNNYTIETLATDPDTSTFTATPTSVMADGISTTLLTATLKDASSNPVAGSTVNVSATDTTVRAINCQTSDVKVITPGRSNSNGQACFLAVSSTMANNVEFTATDTTNSTEITQKAYVDFVNCIIDKNTSTFVSSKAQVDSDGVDSTDLTVHLADYCGFDVNKENVVTIDDNSANTTTYTPPGSTPPQSYTTTGTGQATTAVSSLTTGTVTFDAGLNEEQYDTSTYVEDPSTPNEYNGSGTLIAGSENQDDAEVTFNMPFDFTLYDQTVTAGNPVYLCTNGFLSLSSSGCPTSGNLTNAIAGFHTDLLTTNGGIYQRSDTDSITFIWDARADSAIDGIEPIRFEIKLFRNNRIEIHYETAETINSKYVGIYNNNSVGISSLLSEPHTHKATKFEYDTPISSFNLTDHPQVEFLAGEPEPANSTVEATPTQVTANGSDYSTITVTVLDDNSNPISGRDIQLDQNKEAVITQVDCTDLVTPDPAAQTDSNGQTCYNTTNTLPQTVTFTATDITGLPLILGSDDVEFECVTGANQQCVQVSVQEGEGTITMSAPESFNFLTTSTNVASQIQFTCDDTTACPDNSTGYIHNVNDLLEIVDTRDNGGFTVQVQASTPFETASGAYMPFQNFFIATTPASTGGTQIDGIEYDSEYSGLTCSGSPLNTTGSLIDENSFLFNFGSENTIPSTVHDLMQCELNTGEGRTATLKQNVNYSLQVPALQSAGTYNVILTYDLII